MSVADALHDWKQLAESAQELKIARKTIEELQSVYDAVRAEFEQGMEELDEEERAAILSIMSIYEQQSAEGDSKGSPAANGQTSFRAWLINKVGNEGAEGIHWGAVLDAWTTQFPDTPVHSLQAALYQNRQLFHKEGMGRKAVLHLTPEGQSVFRNSP